MKKDTLGFIALLLVSFAGHNALAENTLKVICDGKAIVEEEPSFGKKLTEETFQLKGEGSADVNKVTLTNGNETLEGKTFSKDQKNFLHFKRYKERYDTKKRQLKSELILQVREIDDKKDSYFLRGEGREYRWSSEVEENDEFNVSFRLYGTMTCKEVQ